MAALMGDDGGVAGWPAAGRAGRAGLAGGGGGAPGGSAPLGVVDVLDRDGQVRQSQPVHAWPLSIGRALDNDLVLSDPHVAPQHLLLAPGGSGVEVMVGDTRNGVQVGARQLLSGEQGSVAPHGDAVELTAGRTRLRLRLAGYTLAPEQPLAVLASRRRRFTPMVVAALLLLAGLIFNTYLQNDPETLTRAVGGMLLSAVSATAVWCSAWALLSKTFTRQAYFGWHLRVFLFAALALIVVDAVPNVVAFTFSWPAATDFSFIATIAVAATALYFHLLAVEPARHRLLKGVAATGAVAGIVLTLWFNQQRSDRYGDELYMSHLLPPGLRLAKPVATDAFIKGLDGLKPVLDRKAKDPAGGDDAGTKDDDDE